MSELGADMAAATWIKTTAYFNCSHVGNMSNRVADMSIGPRSLTAITHFNLGAGARFAGDKRDVTKPGQA